jgi:hypothetical protein
MKRPPRTNRPDPVIDRLAGEGRIRPATKDLDEVLAKRGPLRGPVTDAGTRALQEQRGDDG